MLWRLYRRINVEATGGRATEIALAFLITDIDGSKWIYKYQSKFKKYSCRHYNLTVTDNSGCTDKLQVILLQNNEIRLEYTKNSACYNYSNASITITNIAGDSVYYREPYLDNLEYSRNGKSTK
jgi:hypothetical protein